MSAKKWIRRTGALLLAATAVGVVPSLVPASPTVSAQATDAGAGGEFFPLPPTRILDTRDTGAKPISTGGSTFEVDVTGVGGVPDANVLAVGVNVTVVNPGASGYLSVRPTDFTPAAGSDPTSLLNFNAGQTVPNFTIVGVGSEGKVEIELVGDRSASANVLVDVFGWVATSSYAGADEADGARIVPQDPQRALDTRNGPVPAGYSQGTPLGTKGQVEVPIRGRAGVPNSDTVTGVVFNMTGINTSAGNTSTYVTISPTAISTSAADAPFSSGNFASGQIKSNLVMTPLSDAGSVFVYNRGGANHVALDVVGYLEKGADGDSLGGRLVPLEAPFRSFDTRQDEFGATRLGFSSWEDWSFEAFANSVTLDGSPVGAQSGLLGNLTAFSVERLYPTVSPGWLYMTLNPTDPTGAAQQTEPGNSNLNLREGEAVANMSLVTYGSNGEGDDNMVSAYNSGGAGGNVHYLLDVYAVILAD